MKTILVAIRASTGGRVALALFAVPAILIGLLAMHVLATDTMAGSADHHSSMSQTATAGSDMIIAPTPAAASLGDHCGGICMPSHDMLGMMCVLALLAGAILFAVRLHLSGWPDLRRILEPIQRAVAAQAPATPPSLHVLSISRT